MPNQATISGIWAQLLHATRHQNGGADLINIAALSGQLPDEQDAGKIKGVIIDDSSIADGKVLTYVSATGKVEYI